MHRDATLTKSVPCRPTHSVISLAWPRAARTVALGALLFLASGYALPCGATREFPRINASMSYGVAGLFHDEYVGQAPRASEVGRFSSGAYGLDVAYLFPSRILLGVRAHMLRVAIGDGSDVGRLDLVPAVFMVGYRRPALAGRLGGFVIAGAGAASARFSPGRDIESWQPWSGSEINLTESDPLVFEALGGVDVFLSEDFSLELSVASVLMDTELTFRPAPIDGSEDGFAPGRSYRVKGRHLMLSAGLRWWVEWW